MRALGGMVTCTRASDDGAVALSTDPDRFYADTLEPLFGPLNAPEVDFAALRAKLPKSNGKTTTRKAIVADDTTVSIHRGDLEVGSVSLAEGGTVVVLGDCRVRDGVFSPLHAYSALVVGGKLVVDRLHSSGDVVAFGGIHADVLWGSDNDHSTYAPHIDVSVFVASGDRSTIATKLVAKESIVGFDVDAQIAARFAGLDPKEDASIRDFCKIPKAKAKKAGMVTPELRDRLTGELVAARAAPRLEHVRRIRAVYATIKKQRLVDLGDVVLTQVLWKTRESTESWSIQDELELLAALGHAELLERLRDDHADALEGYRHWWKGLLETARSGA